MGVQMASVVLNARDVERVVAFWKGLLEVGEQHRLDGFVWLARQDGCSVSLAVQHVAEPTEGRNRVHVDFASTDVEQVRRRVVELGGAVVEEHEHDGFAWTVLADPEGNEFCVAAGPSDTDG